MQFVNPLFLIALSALVIPVLIHLFNFRRYKKVWFTNVQFLKELQQETRKQSRLRQLLILLARMLAIASLVFAFAQPYIPATKRQKRVTGQRAVSIYLDNSFSMESVATEGKLIDLAKAKALEIAAAYSQTDLFQLLTNNFEGQHQRYVSQDEFRKVVEEIQVTSAERSLREVTARQADLLSDQQKMTRDAYLISDFQKSNGTVLQMKPDTSVSWFLVPVVAEKRDNLYIDSIHFLSPVHQPGQQVDLRIRIRNASGQTLEKIPVKVSVNNVQKALSSFSVSPNSITEVTLPFTENPGGIQYGLVEIVDYPVVYDDKFYFAYPVLPSIPVQCINEKEGNSYLEALFDNDSTIRFTNSSVRQLDYGSLFTHALLVLNSPEDISTGLARELGRYVLAGGSIVVFPPLNGNAGSYNAFLSQFALPPYGRIDTARQRIAGIGIESPIYSDVFEKGPGGKVILPENIDLPVVSKHYVLEPGARSNSEILLSLQDGHPFLLSIPAGKGQLYLFAAPAEETWTLFPKHMIFVPTLYKIALLSNPSPQLWYGTGENQSIEILADSVPESGIYKLKKLGSGYEIIPEIRKMVRDAGFYSVVNGERSVAGIAFNFNRRESDMACFSLQELEQQASRLPAKDLLVLKEKKSSLTREIHQIRQGTPLWKLFIAFALLFIALEVALIRLMK
jgi:hypothetical protein